MTAIEESVGIVRWRCEYRLGRCLLTTDVQATDPESAKAIARQKVEAIHQEPVSVFLAWRVTP